MKAIAFIKKYARAGIALAAVLGFSAFKMSDDPKQSTRVLVYNQALDRYVEISNYNPNDCLPGTNICSYTTEASTSEVPTSFPADEISNYSHLMEQLGEANKRYDL